MKLRETTGDKARVPVPRILAPGATLDFDRRRRPLYPIGISLLRLVAQAEPAPRILAPDLAQRVRRYARMLAWSHIGMYVLLTGSFLIGLAVFSNVLYWLPPLYQLGVWAGTGLVGVLLGTRMRNLARRWPPAEARETLLALEYDSHPYVRKLAARALRGLPKEGNEAVPATLGEGTGREISAAETESELRRARA